MDQLGSDGFILSNHIGKIFCAGRIDGDDCVDMVWHYYELIDLISRIPLWYLCQTGFSNRSNAIQTSV